MTVPVRALLLLARRAPGLAGRLLAEQQTADLDAPVSRRTVRRMPASDREVFADPAWRADVAEDMREALRQGSAAAVQDLRLGTAPLGVDVEDLTVDTVLLTGPKTSTCRSGSLGG